MEGGKRLSNLTAPGVSQTSASTQLNLNPVISSFRDALDAAVSVSIPALVKSAVTEATTTKSRLRGKRARSPSSITPHLLFLRTLFNTPLTKKSCKTKHLEHRSKHKCTKVPKRHRSKHHQDSSSSPAISSSLSGSEEGELSGTEGRM